MTTFRSFQDLDCWKASKEVRVFVISVVKTLPKKELYALADNITRAARSATRNIAEGFGRFHHQENIQFCRVSRGSLYELLDDLDICLEEKYISPEMFNNGNELIQKACRILSGYIRYIEKAKKSSKSNPKSK